MLIHYGAYHKKEKTKGNDRVMLTEECSAIIQKKLPPKLKDPRGFTISCTIGPLIFRKTLYDLRASINLMPLFIYKPLGIREIKPTTMSV